MVLNAIFSFILKQCQDTEKNETLLSMHISTYWFDFLQYACERITKSWPALSMSPSINIPSAARSDWPQNISRPLGCNVESIFHVDQIGICNTTVYIWLFMKASHNLREPFNQGVNLPPRDGRRKFGLKNWQNLPPPNHWAAVLEKLKVKQYTHTTVTVFEQK